MAVVAWLTQQTAADWCRAARLLRLTIKHSPQSLALPGLMVKSRLLRDLGPRRAAPVTQFHRRALCRISSQRCTGAHWCLLPRAAEASAEAAHTSAHTCWPLREPHEQGLTSARACVQSMRICVQAMGTHVINAASLLSSTKTSLHAHL